MKVRSNAVALKMLAGAALLSLGVGGCRVFPVPRPPDSHIAAPVRGASVLVVILDALYPQDRANLRQVVVSAVRAGEHLIVMDAADGATLGSFTAPSGPAMTGPVLPKAPPRDATSFQQAAYRRRLAHTRAELAHDLHLLSTLQSLRLRTWATSAVAAVLTAAARLGGAGPAGRRGGGGGAQGGGGPR